MDWGSLTADDLWGTITSQISEAASEAVSFVEKAQNYDILNMDAMAVLQEEEEARAQYENADDEDEDEDEEEGEGQQRHRLENLKLLGNRGTNTAAGFSATMFHEDDYEVVSLDTPDAKRGIRNDVSTREKVSGRLTSSTQSSEVLRQGRNEQGQARRKATSDDWDVDDWGGDAKSQLETNSISSPITKPRTNLHPTSFESPTMSVDTVDAHVRAKPAKREKTGTRRQQNATSSSSSSSSSSTSTTTSTTTASSLVSASVIDPDSNSLDNDNEFDDSNSTTQVGAKTPEQTSHMPHGNSTNTDSPWVEWDTPIPNNEKSSKRDKLDRSRTDNQLYSQDMQDDADDSTQGSIAAQASNANTKMTSKSGKMATSAMNKDQGGDVANVSMKSTDVLLSSKDRDRDRDRDKEKTKKKYKELPDRDIDREGGGEKKPAAVSKNQKSKKFTQQRVKKEKKLDFWGIGSSSSTTSSSLNDAKDKSSNGGNTVAAPINFGPIGMLNDDVYVDDHYISPQVTDNGGSADTSYGGDSNNSSGSGSNISSTLRGVLDAASSSLGVSSSLQSQPSDTDGLRLPQRLTTSGVSFGAALQAFSFFDNVDDVDLTNDPVLQQVKRNQENPGLAASLSKNILENVTLLVSSNASVKKMYGNNHTHHLSGQGRGGGGRVGVGGVDGKGDDAFGKVEEGRGDLTASSDTSNNIRLTRGFGDGLMHVFRGEERRIDSYFFYEVLINLPRVCTASQRSTLTLTPGSIFMGLLRFVLSLISCILHLCVRIVTIATRECYSLFGTGGDISYNTSMFSIPGFESMGQRQRVEAITIMIWEIISSVHGISILTLLLCLYSYWKFQRFGTDSGD